MIFSHSASLVFLKCECLAVSGFLREAGVGWPSSEQFWLEVCAWEECRELNASMEASILAKESFYFFFVEQNFMES